MGNLGIVGYKFGGSLKGEILIDYCTFRGWGLFESGLGKWGTMGKRLRFNAQTNEYYRLSIFIFVNALTKNM